MTAGPSRPTPASFVGTAEPSQGGTGLTGVSAHGVLIGQGVDPLGVIAPGSSGFVFTANGPSADPSWQSGGGGGGGVTQPIIGTPDVTLGGSASITTASGGQIFLIGGDSTSGDGGAISIGAGAGIGSLGAGVTIRAGYAAPGAGGNAVINAGDGSQGGKLLFAGGTGVLGVGGNAYLIGGLGIHAAGGFVDIRGGDSISSIAGDVQIRAGTGLTAGNVIVTLPTTDPHVSGALWASGAGHNVVVSQG